MSTAPYAVQTATARGRLHPEAEAPIRSPWQRNLARLAPRSADDIRHAGRPAVACSPAMDEANLAIRHFPYARPYRRWRINRMARKARLTVESIFTILGTDKTLLPDGASAPALAARARDDMAGACRVVADYTAGMTDRCAMEKYRRLTDLSSPG
ncbi:hypothetical protein [Komagataeibacter nataicola]|uniref:Phosphohydrolase-associated domain-containing protein n=1 Tax=Komagataeibacter nataicola TaxID=265960 RepID=A0ABX5PCS7_9PROT|nr:hypothetical protein [Komagataeibacter nataicola]PYD66017.1 hypothetical protein CDI09_10460 [Komagataeibacter nataicola]GBR20125.1 hypothetical protein AA0616_1713 [Komagataeibacter nataicola NRIC 0616]